MSLEESLQGSSNLFKENLARWEELFPDEAAQIAKFKPNNQKNKTENSYENIQNWFSNLDLNNVNVLFVYGVGYGELYDVAKEWLQNPAHYLVFLENDKEAIYHLLHTPKGRALLQDKQVRLQFFDLLDKKLDDVWRKLAELFHPYEFQVASLNSQVGLDLKDSVKLRLSYWINLYQVERAEYHNGSMHYFDNFYKNLIFLPDAYLADNLFQKFKGIPAIICGAGPSLDKNIDLLSNLGDKALIFAGGTAMNAVNSHGLLPSFGVGIDPHLSHETRILMNVAFETPFIYRSRMNHHALDLLQSPLIYVSGSSSVRTPKWFENRLGIVNTIAINEGHNVINFSTALACLMGCNPIVFVGVDLAYTDMKSYQSGVQGHALHQRKDFRTKSVHEELLIRNDIFGKPIQTLWKWTHESIWYGEFARLHPEVTFINSTEGGLGMTNYVPNIPLQQVVDQYLKIQFNIPELTHNAIQASTFPETVTLDNIYKLSAELAASLVRCEKLYTKLSVASENFAIKLRKKLEAEPAYQYILTDFERQMHRSLKLSLQQINYDHDLAFKEKILQKNRLKEGVYKVISEIALTHQKMIKNLVLDKINSEKQSEAIEISPPLSIEIPTDAIVYRYKSGKVYAVLHFEQGLSEGIQRYYYKNGQPKTALEYKQGKLNGSVKLYYANGKPKRELHFLMGQRHGIEHMWSKTGMPLIEAEYSEGKPIGLARKWYSNGQLAKEVSFDANGKEKESQYWTPEGKEIPREIAYNDDYFDVVTKRTEELTDSLGTVFTHLNAMAPLLNADEKLKKELDKLRSEMDHLRSVNDQLKFESGLQSENDQEPIWKSPALQKEMQKKLEEMKDSLNAGLNQMQDIIKGLIAPRKK